MRRFDEAGPKQGCERIAAYFAKTHAKGDIDTPDSLHAAGVQASLSRGELHFRRLLSLAPEPSAETIEKEVEAAVTTFLTAYARNWASAPAPPHLEALGRLVMGVATARFGWSGFRARKDPARGAAIELPSTAAAC